MWDWLIDILRLFFFFLDTIIYPLISVAYNLLIDIANTTVFTEDIIDLFASKVYALLGIFMLFKVSFSILTYIVNPDDFTDKSKGFGKMISNIVITLVLLVATPWIFSQAMDIQRIVLKDNIIGKIFSVNAVSNVSTDDAGNTMAFDTLLAFYHIDEDNVGYGCSGLEYGELKESSVDTCKNYLGDSFDEFNDVLETSHKTKSVNFYMDFDLLNRRTPNNDYVMSYLPLISTIAGGFICWILIIFCFDVAVRSVKLGFLRMIAPVPIISRIDPKKGMDVFNKWVKSCTSTYLDLFIRLLAIYFAVFVISLVGDMNFVDASTGLPADVNLFVKVFIIMGALLFAKQLPQLIEELTGVKMGGKFTMNPLKKLEDVPLVGNSAANVARFTGRTARTLGGLGLAGIGGIGRATAHGIDNRTGNRISSTANRVRTWGRNVRDNARNRVDNFLDSSETLRNAANRVGRDFHSIANDARSTTYGAIGGIPGTANVLSARANEYDAQLKEYDNIVSSIDSMLKKANSEMIKYDHLEFKDNAGNHVTMADFKNAKEYLSSLRGKDTSHMNAAELADHVKEINRMQTNVSMTEKLAEQAFIDAVRTGHFTDVHGVSQEFRKINDDGSLGDVITDVEITSTYANVQRTVASSSDATVRTIDTTTANGMKKGKDALTEQKATVKNSRDYEAAMARRDAIPKSGK